MTARPPVAPADLEGMRQALQWADQAARVGEVPVGAVLILDGTVIGAAGNEMVFRRDPTAHAELLALRQAVEQGFADSLHRATLYVTLEPCAQFAGAIVLCRVGRVVFGAWDPKAGMVGSIHDLLRHPNLNHRPEVRGGVLEAESSLLLRSFFERLRED